MYWQWAYIYIFESGIYMQCKRNEWKIEKKSQEPRPTYQILNSYGKQIISDNYTKSAETNERKICANKCGKKITGTHTHAWAHEQR